MKFIRENIPFLLISLLFLGLRFFASDPWLNVVLTNDTSSYVITSEQPLFSKGFISGERPVTVPLIYKLFRPENGYGDPVRSEPSIGIAPGLKNLAGYSGVGFFQSALSVICWWFLAFTLYWMLKRSFAGLASASFLLLSACLPEIVSWDHVMMSESLSNSLFALLLGFALLLFTPSLFNGKPASRTQKILAGLFIATMFFWVNTRDTNVYFLLIATIILVLSLLVVLIRWKFTKMPLVGLCIVLFLIFTYGFQQYSVKNSTRITKPIINNLIANIFPYWTRVEFMHEKWGMPDDPEIISITGSANYSGIMENLEFVEWANEKGMPAYMDFMIQSPLWTTEVLINSVDNIFGYYKQPYFDTYSIPMPINIRKLSRVISWSSSDMILISFLMVLFAGIRDFRKKEAWPLIGIMACIWLGAGVMYAASYLGETWGSAARHIQNVILAYRLLIMVFIPILLSEKSVYAD